MDVSLTTISIPQTACPTPILYWCAMPMLWICAYHLKELSAFLPGPPAIPCRSVQCFHHINFQLGEAAAPANENQWNRSNLGQAGGPFNPRQLRFGLKLSF